MSISPLKEVAELVSIAVKRAGLQKYLGVKELATVSKQQLSESELSSLTLAVEDLITYYERRLSSDASVYQILNTLLALQKGLV